MGFSRQECWSGLPFPSPGDLPNPGIEPGSPTLQADTLPSEPTYKYSLKKKKKAALGSIANRADDMEERVSENWEIGIDIYTL